MSSSNQVSQPEPLLTIKQAAEYLAESTKSIRRKVEKKFLPELRTSWPKGPLRFRRSDLDRALRRPGAEPDNPDDLDNYINANAAP